MAGSVNKVILVGNLGADPEIRRTQDGRPVANLRLATSDSWKDKATGERREKTEWHRVVIFNENLCRIAEQYLKKGSKVYIEGQLQTRKWQDQSGQDRYSTEVVLQGFRGELTLLDRSGSAGAGGGGDFGADDTGNSARPDQAARSPPPASERATAARAPTWTTRFRFDGVAGELPVAPNPARPQRGDFADEPRSAMAGEPAIQLHALAAMAAFAIGVAQLDAPKGTPRHRAVGWLWVLLMLVVAVSAFFIHTIRLWGPWSPIHLLAIFTLVMLPIACWTRTVTASRSTARHDLIFLGALVIAGIFTFYPGRIMHAVVFGH